MSTNAAAERLARAVTQRRREELDLTQLDVHAAGGPSNSTLTAIEAGTLERAPSRTTFRKLDAGLQWEPGSARRVWEGKGDPHPVLPGVDPKTSAYLRETIGQAVLDEATKHELLDVLDRRGVKGA